MHHIKGEYQMSVQYIQLAVSPEDIANAELLNEATAMEQFRAKMRQHRATYQAFIGQDGDTQVDLSWSQRRRIMGALRKSTAVLGMGKKSRIGRLGGGAAIGAILVGFTTPAMAQYAVGGGVANDPGAIAIGGSTDAGLAGTNTVDTDGNGTQDYTRNDDVAIGTNASAIGGDTVAIGHNVTTTDPFAVAIGSGSSTTGFGAVAIGHSNVVDSYGAGTSTITQGVLNRATGAGNLTLGNGTTGAIGVGIGIGQSNTVDGAGIAIGGSNLANNAGSTTIAIGIGNAANGAYSQAFGVGNLSSASSAIAIGVANTASNNTAIAIGRQNTASGQTSIALGNLATANQTNAIAIGHSTQATAAGTIAIGGGTGGASTNLDATAAIASAANAIAIGTNAQATGTSALALGDLSTSSGPRSTAVGVDTTASGQFTFAGGDTAAAAGDRSVAIGLGAAAGTAATASSIDKQVAVGALSNAQGIGSVALGYMSNANQTAATAVGDQAKATAQYATSAGFVANASGTSSTAIGHNSAASGATSIAAGNNTVASGISSTALGANTIAAGASAIAIGNGSSASNTNTIAIGTGNTVSGANSGAIGDPNTVTGSGSYALGNNNTINANNAFAIGNSITIAAGLNGSVGIGDASSVSAAVGTTTATVGATTFSGFAGTAPSSTVSIGASGAERTLTNVAAGRVNAASTDAINGSQLFSVATVVDANKTAIDTLGNSLETVTGGGLVINPNGSIATAPSITAAGSTFSTVTGAIQALNAANTTTNTGLASALGGGATVAANGAVTAPSYSIGGTTYNDVGSALSALNSGSLVAQTGGSPGTGQITLGAATGGTSISVAGTSGSRTVTGVLGGSLAAASTDAVNGGQINKLGASIAANTGGGSAFNPVTGTVTAPTVNVGGTAYTNLTSAIEAAGAGFSLTTAASGSGTATGTTIEGIAAGETVTVTAGNNIAITQTGNQIAVALKSALTGLSSVSVTGGPTLAVGGITNAGTISGVIAGSTASTSTDAINGSQLNTALSSLATDLGGGASYNPVTGIVTAPGYAIDGTTYTNVGAALAALAADSKYIAFNSALAPANASGTNASAVGPNAQAAGNNATALGVNSDANGTNSLALGSGAVSTGNNSVALGAGSQAGTNNAGWAGTTIAGVTMTNAQNANAVVSVSGGTTNRQITGVADGAVTATSTDAINGAQLFNTASALDAKATNIGAGLAASLGGGAAVAANGVVTQPTINVNGTTFNNVTAAVQAAAAGFNFTTSTSGTGVANGTSVAAIGAGETHTITAGNNIITTQTGNDVAIALNPALSGVTSLAITGGPTITNSGIAMNGDGITGMASGAVNATSTDAITGAQLFASQNAASGSTDALGASVAANLGGTATYDPVTDTVNALSINAAGTAYNTVTGAIEALNTANNMANTGIASALGGGAAIAPNGTVTAPSFAIQGSTYSNVGAALGAVDSSLTNLLNGTAGLVQQTGGFPGAGQITIGAATGGTSVSFAGTSGNRVLTDVASGAITATSDDVINGAQIFANNQQIANVLGGGAGVNPLTGALTGPTYTVGGTTLGNVGAAIAALQSSAPVQYSTLGAPTTPNGLIPSQNMTLVGAAAGPVTLSNVGPAALSTTSTDAVNGSQINTLASSIAANTGGGSVFNPITGTLSAPTIAVGGANYSNVTDAIEASDGKADALGNGTAAALGGGSTYDPATGAVSSPSYTVAGGTQTDAGSAFAALNSANNTANSGLAEAIGGGAAVAPNGSVTAPHVNVNGTNYSNLTDAIAAAGAGFNHTTAATGSGVANGISVAAIGAGETQTTTAGNNIVTTQIANETQIALNSNLTGIDSIAVNGGATIDANGINMNGDAITGLAAGSTTAGSTDAVNGGQVNTSLMSVANTLGGGSTYDPLTGIITAPSYTVAGSAYNTVGDAFGGVNMALSNLTNGTSGLVQQTGGAPGTGQLTVGAATGGTSVSFAGTDGDRSVTGIAAGSLAPASTDAVNGAQVNTLANSLATVIGSSSFDPVTGTVTTPGFAVGGSTYANVAAALGAVDTNLSTINAAVSGGDGIKYFHTNSTMADSAPVGVNAIAVGPVSGASGDQSVSIGLNASAGAINALAIGTNSNAAGISSIAIGNGNQVTGNRSGAIGDPTVITGSDSYSLGNNNTIDANKAFAIGNNITIAAGNDGSVGIGDGATVAAPNSGAKSINGGSIAALAPISVVSVGALGNERQITNVAAGVVSATSTDAINGSQLFAAGTALNNQGSGLAAALGGGASIATNGTVTAPSYTVQGSSYNNVGGAIGAIDGNLGSLNTAVNNLANGTSGLVQQNGGAPGSGVITIGANTGGTVINVAGTSGDRIVTGVADGSVASGSKDAVNGGQLAAVKTTADGALQRSGGTLTGSINAGGNSITNLAAPVNGGDATNKAYVDGVAASAAATSVSIGQSTASALGGGSTYNPISGQVSAPTYTVGGKAYNNAGAAIAATNMLAVQYVADANGQPTNAVRLTGNGNGQAVSMTNVAAGTIAATSTDAVNGGQLYTVQQTANGALQRSGGTLTGNVNFGGNRATGLGGPVDASDAATKGYVDAIQTGNVNSFNLMTQGLNTAFKGIERNSQGVALAIAMGGGFLSDDKDVSLWGAWGNFNGYNAASLQTYIRLSDDVFINAAASYGFQENLLGTRVGVGIQF
jgi:trimeric autotransporter adhesin